ncbi:MAG: CPBP family glutamic-type intramembrane protease [Pseudomonadota bacterium]
MNIDRASLDHRPISAEDFDEFGDSLWIWIFAPLLLALFGTAIFAIASSTGAFYRDEGGTLLIVASSRTVLAFLLTVIAAKALLRRPTFEEGDSTNILLPPILLFIPVVLFISIANTSWLVARMFTGDFQFNLEAGLSGLGNFTRFFDGGFDALAGLLLLLFTVLLREIVFRGLIVGGMIQNGSTPRQAILAGAFLDAIIPFLTGTFSVISSAFRAMTSYGDFRPDTVIAPFIAVIGIFIAGALLSLLRIRTGKLWPCILIALLGALFGSFIFPDFFESTGYYSY